MKNVFKEYNPAKISWWTKFLLLFVKPHYGMDSGCDGKTIVTVKVLFGKYYITNIKSSIK